MTALATAGGLAAAGCDDTAIVLQITSPLAVPAQLDGVCISVAALDTSGEDGVYAEPFTLASVPQTLTVLPGGHGQVAAWARGTRGGVEVARAGGEFGFSEREIREVRLELPRCEGGALTPRAAGRATVAAGARTVVAFGWRAPVLLAIAPGAAKRFGVRDEGLAERVGGLPAAPAAAVAGLVAFDADGDCDDDVLLLPASSAPLLWRQDGDGGFAQEAAGLAAAGTTTAAAAADVDGDGDLDLALVSAGKAALWRNDGSGEFARDATAIPAAAGTDVTAVAWGDVSGDGHPDLIVGQGSQAAAARRVLVNDVGGQGTFTLAPALLSELAERTRVLVVADADGDGDLDLLTAGIGAPVRLYVNRGEGLLEDQSFVRLPNVNVGDVSALVVSDVDGDCRADVVFATADGSASLWRGGETGAFTAVSLPGGATGVAEGDVDGDGRRDVVLVSGDELTWVVGR